MQSKSFLPIFPVNRINLLKKLDNLEGDFGVLGTIFESNNFLHHLRDFNKTFFIDGGVFDVSKSNWYIRTISLYRNNQWIRQKLIAPPEKLREYISSFLNRCDKFTPDYVFAPDVIGEPLLSLYLSRIAWEEYSSKKRDYYLIGVVQVGRAIYNWPQQKASVPTVDSLLPFFSTPKSFLSSLISEYKCIGYQQIALGGLLKSESTMPMGLKFGLSNQELDDLLSWSRPQFVLGGLALTRLEILKKHNVWADSSNWLWWDKRYDQNRFGDRDTLQEVVSQSLVLHATTPSCGVIPKSS